MAPGRSGATGFAHPSNDPFERSMSYPPNLQKIVDLFSLLSEEERRETLITYADQSSRCAPKAGEEFDLEDVRKDEECTDTVGIFLQVAPDRKVTFRVTLGPKVQTLTKAMTSILCKGLDGITIEAIQEVPADFVPKIIGAELVRARSQTVYYILTRMKSACTVWQRRERAAAQA